MDWNIASVGMVTVTYRARNVCGEGKGRVPVIRDGKKEGNCDIVRVGSKNGWNQILMHDNFESWRDRPYENTKKIKNVPKSGMSYFAPA